MCDDLELIWSDAIAFKHSAITHHVWRSWADLKWCDCNQAQCNNSSCVTILSWFEVMRLQSSTVRTFIMCDDLDLIWSDAITIKHSAIIYHVWRSWSDLKWCDCDQVQYEYPSCVTILIWFEVLRLQSSTVRTFIMCDDLELIWSDAITIKHSAIIHHVWRSWADLKWCDYNQVQYEYPSCVAVMCGPCVIWVPTWYVYYTALLVVARLCVCKMCVYARVCVYVWV